MILMKKVVMTAYDVNPFKGSESGTGWNFPFHLAEHNRITLITRKNNRQHIEAFVSESMSANIANMDFRYFDLPYWLRFWKRRSRGARLYFWLWQLGVIFYIRKNHLAADIYHGLNFHSDNTPSFLWLLGGKTVWGPINHNEMIPSEFLSDGKAKAKDMAKWIFRRISWACDPFIHLAKRKTSLVLAANQSVVKRLNLGKRDNYRILATISSLEMETAPPEKGRHESFQFLTVGRFVPIKSIDFALQTFEKFFQSQPAKSRRHVSLIVVGSGPLEEKLYNQVENYTSKDHILFRSWVSQRELFEIYRSSDCFINFSHEGGGAVNAEAMANGLPIICFDNFGAGETVQDTSGIKVPISDLFTTSQEAATALATMFDDRELVERMSRNSYAHFKQNLSWRARALAINEYYQELL